MSVRLLFLAGSYFRSIYRWSIVTKVIYRHLDRKCCLSTLFYVRKARHSHSYLRSTSRPSNRQRRFWPGVTTALTRSAVSYCWSIESRRNKFRFDVVNFLESLCMMLSFMLCYLVEYLIRCFASRNSSVVNWNVSGVAEFYKLWVLETARETDRCRNGDGECVFVDDPTFIQRHKTTQPSFKVLWSLLRRLSVVLSYLSLCYLFRVVYMIDIGGGRCHLTEKNDIV